MIYNADYTDKKSNYRYIFIKYLPNMFYPYVLKYLYKKVFGKKLNLKNPKRLSEKLLWNCLYEKNPKKTLLSDKLKAKEYVAKIIPDLKLAKTYQIASAFEKLKFETVIYPFVIKTTHAWKSHILVDKKMTKEEYDYCKKYYDKVLSINFAYWNTPELQYKDIKAKVYLEEYLCTNEEESYIQEYEVYCFNGEPEFLNYSISPSCSFSSVIDKKDCQKSQYFDAAWNRVDFKIKFDSSIPAPATKNKKRIIDYAKILSKDFDFVRIDFFEMNDELYFGEFSFTPFAGFIDFQPEYYDLIYGKKLK